MRLRRKVKSSSWRINSEIHAPKVRVIDQKGKQVGILDTGKAVAMAKEAGVDLVEIAPKAKPPVTKIIDFGKFRYQEEKKKRAEKKKTKSTDVKEVRFSPFIAKQDFETRLNRVKEFLGEGHKIRLVVKFKKRQMPSKSFGYELLGKVKEELGEAVSVDMDPKFVGFHLAMVISPRSQKGIAEVKNQEKKQEKKEKQNAKTEDKKITDQAV